jgi:hypothetical protein
MFIETLLNACDLSYQDIFSLSWFLYDLLLLFALV